MLQAKNIHKSYVTKAGKASKAISDVCLNLDQVGLVFILGKSGSGKSTLLNILGGLDTMDEGEIIINGKSSKDFKASDFDSYRNTYLGFVFQDFNMLPDFTVAENINLAYELQHKKADIATTNQILKQVDLLEFKERKPNELSIGQVQRVAIARALVKNPDIIMADEPTGSLDSDSGKQVFEMLKSLSKQKLVIVVSHDRESAETYADRIIELKDGKLIRDVSKEFKTETLERGSNIKLLDSKLIIKQGATLNNKDLDILNKAIQNENMQIEVSSSHDALTFDQLNTTYFVDTAKQAKKQDGFQTPFKLIKSKLPNYSAFKMGKSSLKHKKIKLVFTLFLTIIALTMFGLADIMGSFSLARASAQTFSESNYTILPFLKEEYHQDYDYYSPLLPAESDRLQFEQIMGRDAYYGYKIDFDISTVLKNQIPSYNYYYLSSNVNLIELPSSEALKDNFVGRFPENSNELLINNYMLEYFKEFSYNVYNSATEQYQTIESITSFSQLDGKQIPIWFNNIASYYTIVGMVNYDLSSYAQAKMQWESISADSDWEEISKIKDFFIDKSAFLNRFVVKEGFYYDNYVSNIASSHFSLREKSATNKKYDIIYSLNNLTVPNGITGEIEIDELLNKKNRRINKLENYNTATLQDNSQFYFGAEVVAPTTLGEFGIVLPASWYAQTEILEAEEGNPATGYIGYDTAKLDQFLNTNITLKVYSQNGSSYTFIEQEIVCTVLGFSLEHYDFENSVITLSTPIFEQMLTHTVAADLMYTYLNNNATDYQLFSNMEANLFKHNTQLSFEIYNISEMFRVTKRVFFYISIVMGAFVAAMILNFISTSISYKKKEIGILRALGARKIDVFKVFYFEGLIMGVIDYAIAMALITVGVTVFNSFVQAEMATSVVVLGLTLKSFIVVGAVCFGVIFFASLLPVYKIASKKPIDAIKNH